LAKRNIKGRLGNLYHSFIHSLSLSLSLSLNEMIFKYLPIQKLIAQSEHFICYYYSVCILSTVFVSGHPSLDTLSHYFTQCLGSRDYPTSASWASETIISIHQHFIFFQKGSTSF
jgi:hypothetical protein